MKKITINALVDIAGVVTFIPSLVTGIVLYLVLPSGSGKGGILYLGMYREQWVTMHNYSSFLFAALVIIHLLLHVNFFRNIRKCLVTKDPACEVQDR